MTRIAVFASGRGSNLARILEACDHREIQATVALVVSNEPDAGAVDIARANRIPVLVADHRDYADRLSHEQAIIASLEQNRIDLVILAGYMRLVSPFLLGYLYDPQLRQSRILNIHPADPALYQGKDGYGWAIATRQTETAVTVHFVNEGMDTGDVILQEPIVILADDTVASLRARGQAVEHHLYPFAIQMVIDRLQSYQPCAAS